jgi:hypothetical protein
MYLNRVSILCLGLSLSAAPAAVWAQAAGESSAMGLHDDEPHASAVATPPPSSEPLSPAVEMRSPLWMAVDAVHRQRDAGSAPSDRRLSAEQRQQLREQIRRASGRSDLRAPGTQLGQR